uniref:Uncharacterized protein n=1 Tax=Cannabis sativa TaxID=3483 RepID=A0A803QK65_CANSA
MNYLNKVLIAGSVVAVQGRKDQAKLKPCLRSLQLNRQRLFSSSSTVSSSSAGESTGMLSLAGVAGLGLFGLIGNCEDRIRQADESIQKVMYLNCWGQS